MRVLMTTQPGLGHFHPMIPLAQALQEQGHTVLVACAAAFAPRVAAAGLKSVPAGLDWLESEADQLFPELQQMVHDNQHFWLLTDVFSDEAAHRMVADLVPLCQSWQPDIIVRNDYEFAACVVAEQLELPCVTIGIEFFALVRGWETLLGSQLSYLRSSCGLSPHPITEMFYRYLYFSLLPLNYQFPSLTPLPATVRPLRPISADQANQAELPAWLSHLPDQPTVYATLGTVFNRSIAILHMLLAAFQELPVNLILTVGQNQDPHLFGKQPANIRIERYIPQSLLFPHCDLVITHGGFNTLMTALDQALPVLVIPISAHHPLHALRCAALGVGLVARRPDQFTDYLNDLTDDQWVDLTVQGIRTAVQRLLNNPAYRRNAECQQQVLEAMPSAVQAVDLLMQLQRERVPLTMKG